MRKLVVGPDFAMGRNRDGSVETLPGLASDIGFEFKSVDLITDPSGLVKSTAIRKQIADGQVSGAAHLLGRNFSVNGTVVQGQKRGRELGFPTANLDVDSNLIIPCDGIYATWAHLEGGSYMAATSIGLRPTFDDGENRTVEAFLLDFSEDLYGQTLRLEFVQRLRGEEKYDTVEALLEQMDKDVQQTRAALSLGDTPIEDSK
jgi:riboflavin kinase/FMN adenylyltransferase